MVFEHKRAWSVLRHYRLAYGYTRPYEQTAQGQDTVNEAASPHKSAIRWLESPTAFFVAAGILIVLGGLAASPLLTALGTLVAWRERNRPALWFGVFATVICIVLALLVMLANGSGTTTVGGSSG